MVYVKMECLIFLASKKITITVSSFIRVKETWGDIYLVCWSWERINGIAWSFNAITLFFVCLSNHNCEAVSPRLKRFIFSKIFPTHRYQNGRGFSTLCICFSACTLRLLNLAWYIETKNIWGDHGSIRSNYLSLFFSFP